MVVNKCSDLIARKGSGEFMKYRRATKDIKELRIEWNEKMKALQDQGYDKQNLKNMHRKKTKLNDLEFLKSQRPLGFYVN